MQSIIIHTHLAITPDMLHDISTQIESGKERGFTPYEWELWDNYIKELKEDIENLNDDIDDLDDTIDHLNDTIDDYKDEINELNKLYEETDDEVKRLKDILSSNNISYE